ncbi:hypothetical protein [Streptomyces hilarionis]|uniref:hypothetical protein n=1 Tax=Streptomyces hilarionis TaxID=2839954 RepID=UPI00211A4E16|nr:hypothetical protein [Streptomyces hilarionis]MCQ9132657.1 hypothetical protein [Streptomyces hilarionis]
MAAQEHEEDWDDAEPLEEGSEEDSPSATAETASEHRMIRALAEHKIDLRSTKVDSFQFTAHPKWNLPGSREVHLPRSYHATLLTQLEKKVVHTSRWAGIAIPSDGFLEVLLGLNQSQMPVSHLARRLSMLVADSPESECARRHDPDNSSSINFARFRDDSRTYKIHLTGEAACIELSGPSPACHILTNHGFSQLPRYTTSLRIFYDRSMKPEEIEESAEPIIASFLYELDVRNHLNMRPPKWPSQTDRRRPAHVEQPERIVRFPEVAIEPEISVLFRFAGSANGNPPLAFLSYYQVLESFFPVAGKKSALKKIERELTNPLFNRHNDKHLMRLLNVGESAAAASESAHLKMLLDEFVRRDILIDFFRDNQWGKHFTKQGPIRGIEENINLENKQTPLAHQVAERVYRIRNRIVHAKDDPRYQDTPALLPQSDEAESLWPDIDLVRLLVCEVILSDQVRV